MRGRAHVYPKDRITTEEILPAACLTTADEARLGESVLAGLDPGFAGRVAKGDIVIAGEEFGAGPPREQAVWALRGARIAAVVATSFARGFMRDALNSGFLAIECPAALQGVADGDLVEVDLKDGLVRNLSKGTSFRFTPLTPFAMEILEAGGLLPYVMRQTTGGSSA